jgi:hypothetical protein
LRQKKKNQKFFEKIFTLFELIVYLLFATLTEQDKRTRMRGRTLVKSLARWVNRTLVFSILTQNGSLYFLNMVLIYFLARSTVGLAVSPPRYELRIDGIYLCISSAPRSQTAKCWQITTITCEEPPKVAAL